MSTKFALYGTEYDLDWVQYQISYNNKENIDEWSYINSYNSIIDFSENLEVKGGILYTF